MKNKFFKYLAIATIPFMLGVGVVHAYSAPSGQKTINQGIGGTAVTASDVTVLTPTRAIFNGNATACNIAVIFVLDSSAVTLNNVQPGAILPITVTKVMSTNTTCSNIVAFY